MQALYDFNNYYLWNAHIGCISLQNTNYETAALAIVLTTKEILMILNHIPNVIQPEPQRICKKADKKINTLCIDRENNNNIRTNFFCEYYKLDPIDLKAASWLRRKNPCNLFAFLKFISDNHYRRKGALVDAQKVFDELTEVYTI